MSISPPSLDETPEEEVPEPGDSFPVEVEKMGVTGTIDKQENGIVATCECGWESSARPTVNKAEQSFNGHASRAKEHQEEREKNREENESTEETEESVTKAVKPPHVEAREEALSFLEEELPKVYGLGKKKSKRIMETIRRRPKIIDNSTNLYYHIKQYSGGKINDYDLRNVLDSMYEKIGGEPREMQRNGPPPSMGQRGQGPEGTGYKYSGSEQGGRTQSSGANPSQQGRRDLSNLPRELQEIVEERRRKREADQLKEELGVDRLEQQLNKLAKIIQQKGEGGNEGQSGKSDQKELAMKGLKYELLNELRDQGAISGGRGGVADFYDRIGELGEGIVDAMAPGVFQFMQSMGETQKVMNAVMLKEIGLDPEEVIQEGKGVSWSEIQEKRKKAEGSSKKKEDVREKLKG